MPTITAVASGLPSSPQLKRHFAGLVSGELEAKSPSLPTPNDLSWLDAWKEVREKSGVDKPDGDVATSVAPLLKALEHENVRVRFLANSLLDYYGPSLAKHPDWIEATKCPGEWSPTLRVSIEVNRKAHSVPDDASTEPKK